MNKLITKILIANRGEIAIRIAKTAKKMGIKTVSIYSDSDSASLHRHFTDESYNISGITSLESYMNIDKILNIIQESSSDAVHPGYGFLSEKENFPKILEDHNIRFIGPSHKSIASLGSKIDSKILAESAGVNIIPGFNESIKDSKIALKKAKLIGFPIMIKASCGGGGKGMRIVFEEDKFEDSFNIVMNESIANYNDDNIFLEKYIEEPRHIEIQVIADKFGNAVYLFERECSIQRRNQKIIEEAPSPFLQKLGKKGIEIRHEMGRQSVNLIKKIGYYSVATVEFVVDKNGHFYFLEVNTRIQVEHAITEEAVRIKRNKNLEKIDLIEWMIRIENNEKLDFKQEDLIFDMHSIETRIYTENPEKNFLPSTGKIENFFLPEENEFLRIENGIRKGSEITPYFDPMIAKICASGKNRNIAISNLKNALSKIIISGSTLKTNLLFLEKIILNKNFLNGEFSTNFISKEFPNNFNPNLDPSIKTNKNNLYQMLIGSLIICLNNFQFIAAHNLGFFPIIDKIYYLTFLYNKKRFAYKIHIAKDENNIKILSINDEILNNEFLIIKDLPHILGIRLINKKINDKVKNIFENELYFKYISSEYNKYYIENSGFSFQCEVYSEKEFNEFQKIFKAKDELSLKNQETSNLFFQSPLPGIILDIYIKEGDITNQTTRLMLIESMKMHNTLTNHCDINLRVKKIFVKKGDIVKSGEKLIEFENIS
jgi:propionyl-CoA carboxylase alpha chain